MGKKQAAKAGDVRHVGSIREWARSPGGGPGNPHQYSRLVGCGPWGCRESGTTDAT